MHVLYVTDPALIAEHHKPDYESIGAAVSVSSVAPAPPAGYAVKDIGDADISGKEWDTAQLDFVDAAPETSYTAAAFFDLFTISEKLAYWSADASIDPVRRAMADYMMTNHIVDRTSAETGILLDILVSAGVITAERKTEINT